MVATFGRRLLTEPEYDDDDDLWFAWQQEYFINIDKTRLSRGFCRFIYDGVPYWQLRFGGIMFTWGQRGWWAEIEGEG
jgi:hypothetical protein